MRDWKTWWAAYAGTLAIGGIGGWQVAALVRWPHPAIAEALILVVLTLPFAVHRSIRTRKARSYARLVARTR